MNVTFHLHSKTNRDGTATIVGKYTHGGRPPYRWSTGVKIQRPDWSTRKNRAKPKAVYAQEVNQILEATERKITKVAYGIMAEGEEPLPGLVKARHKRGSDQTKEFWEWYEVFQREVVETLAQTTWKRYGVMANELREHETMTGRQLHPREIDDTTLHDLMRGMRERGNIESTISRKMRDLKRLLKWMEEKKGVTVNQAYKNVETPQDKKKEQATLSGEEVARLFEHQQESDRLQKTADLFVWHCDTGMRYSEGQNIRPENFNGEKVTYLNGKGPRKVVIERMLTTRAQRIGEKYGHRLPELSNQKFNDYIKEATRAAGLDRQVYDRGSLKPLHEAVHTHTGRHTFSTRLLSAGINLRIVSKMLAHSDTKTTQIYDQTSRKEEFEAVRLLE